MHRLQRGGVGLLGRAPMGALEDLRVELEAAIAQLRIRLLEEHARLVNDVRDLKEEANTNKPRSADRDFACEDRLGALEARIAGLGERFAESQGKSMGKLASAVAGDLTVLGEAVKRDMDRLTQRLGMMTEQTNMLKSELSVCRARNEQLEQRLAEVEVRVGVKAQAAADAGAPAPAAREAFAAVSDKCPQPKPIPVAPAPPRAPAAAAAAPAGAGEPKHRGQDGGHDDLAMLLRGTFGSVVGSGPLGKEATEALETVSRARYWCVLKPKSAAETDGAGAWECVASMGMGPGRGAKE